MLKDDREFFGSCWVWKCVAQNWKVEETQNKITLFDLQARLWAAKGAWAHEKMRLPASGWEYSRKSMLCRAAIHHFRRREPCQGAAELRHHGVRFLRQCPPLRTRVPLSQFSAIQPDRRSLRGTTASADSIGFEKANCIDEEENTEEGQDEKLTWGERWQCACRTLRPWATSLQVMEPAEIRSSIVAFSGHAGLLYALMAGIATTGVFLGENSGVSESGAAAAVTLAATATEAASMLSNFAFCEALLDVTADFIGRQVDSFELAAAAKTPLFISSVFWCLHGLLGSMQTIGRIMAVPESRVKEFVAQNSCVFARTLTCRFHGW